MDINLFWQLLADSRLLNSALLPEIRTNFEATLVKSSTTPTTKDLSGWLIENEQITEYQASILSAGHPGPFVFGNYLVDSKLDSELLPDSFLATHRGTSHPVMLQFLPGKEQDDLERWAEIEVLAGRVSLANSINLVPVFETLVLPNHRAVVTGRAVGKPLCEMLPRKARMPWKDVCVIFAQIARGLYAIHEQGVVHNAISPRTIWLHRGGLAQLRMALFPDTPFNMPDPTQKYPESRLDYLAPEVYVETTVDVPKLSRQSDLYSLGCTMYRALAGRVVFDEPDLPKKRRLHESSTIADLAKFELPEELESLLIKLLAKKPDYRPDNALAISKSLAKLAGGKISVKPVPGISPELTPSLVKLQSSLNRWKPGTESKLQDAVSLNVAPDEDSNRTRKPADERIKSAIASAHKRKNSKWMLPVTIASSLMLVSLLVAGLAFMADQTKFANKDLEDKTAATTPDDENPEPPSSEIPETNDAIQPVVRVVQELINDDRATLWESPTDGNPVEFSYMPSAPKLVFVIRPAELLQTPEGPRLLNSLGPVFGKRLAEWQQKFGMELQDISRLTISLHSNADYEYDFFYQVELPQLTPDDRLLQLWRSPTATQTEDNQTVYKSTDESVFYFVPNTGASDQSTRFVNGTEQLVQEVIVAKGITVWSGAIQRMSKLVDRDRHFSMLFLRPAVFNDEGQWLMSGQLADLNRSLSQLLNDDVRCGLISLHIDRGNYFEFVFDRNAELSAQDLKDSLERSLRRQREILIQFVADLPANAYWDKVRLKYQLMLADFYRNLRIGVEYGDVKGNCWLPSMAAHNLIAASELVTSFSSDVDVAETTTVNAPESLQALLILPRDLSVTTNPDMNILLESIRNEVIDDFGGLPFEFNIRLLGNDLSKEGITQNQRPSDFEMKRTSLADILTTIMVNCNPNKDISGPSDPNCKLIWVVADDPMNPGTPAVLVTTRVAAAEKGYTLPEAFKPKTSPE